MSIDLSVIDLFIILSVLAAVLGVSFLRNRTVYSLTDFALGDHIYNSVGTVSMAMVAAFICGGGTLGLAGRVHQHGLSFFITYLMTPLSFWLAASWLAPRMGRFKNMISAGEVMGSFYGKWGRFIAGLSATSMCTCFVGSQIIALSLVLNYFLSVPAVLSPWIAFGCITVYALSGSERGTSWVHRLKFLGILFVLPATLVLGVIHLGGLSWEAPMKVWNQLPQDQLRWYWPKGELPLPYLSYLVTFFLPLMDPVMLQRLLMAPTVKRMQRSLRRLGWISLFAFLVCGLIGFMAYVADPSIPSELALPVMMNLFLPPILKGLAVAVLMVIILAAGQNYLTAGSINWVHDCIQLFFRRPFSNARELRYIRIATVFLGLVSLYLTTYYDTVIDMMVASFKCWMPVLISLLAGIRGHIGALRCFRYGALAAFVTLIFWIPFQPYNCLLPGMDGFCPTLWSSGMVFWIFLQGDVGSARARVYEFWRPKQHTLDHEDVMNR